MKIGIDARFLTHPQRGGFKTYTESLISALAEVDSENSYLIYLDRPPIEHTLPQKDNFAYRVVKGTIPVIGWPLREQVGLRRAIAKDKPDIVHYLCNTAPVGAIGKFVVTLHDTIQVTNTQPLRLSGSLADYKRWAMTSYSRWTIQKTAQDAARIITVSNYEKDEIVKQLHVAPQKVCVTHLAPNPIFAPLTETEKESWRTQLGRRLNLPNRFILGVGYEARKNIPLLIEAFSRVAPAAPDLNLVVVVAEEATRADLHRLVRDKGLDNRIVLLGALPPHELAALYNLAEAFVYPSERESFGLPPVEAMACGAPTIAMNESSLPEILGDGAWLVDGSHVQDWSDVIAQVISDECLRSELAKRGVQRAASLSWQRCAHDTLYIYNAVCCETGRPA